MSLDSPSSTPLVDAVRRAHVAEPGSLQGTPNPDAARTAAHQRPASGQRRSKRGAGGKTHSSRRAIRLAILAGVLLLGGIWLARNNGLTGLFKQANTTATEI